MALLKVFVSSTCYDLNVVRTQLRAFLQTLGHDPIMSDYNDVLFDPRQHTHENCVKEIGNVDAVVLIIGSRYGGTAIPEAISSLDIDSLKNLSKGSKLLETPDKISITQLEVMKAVESDIPVYTFIDSGVMHDHLFYEKNKNKGILDQLDFPSIEKKDSAIYIFEFINFLRLRSKNNSVVEFNKFADIEDYLRKQWSSLLQRLLFEERFLKSEAKRMDGFSEELKDIKSLILSNIGAGQAKEVGRGVLKFRRLIDFLGSTEDQEIKEILVRDISWEELLEELNIKEIKMFRDSHSFPGRALVFLVKKDGTFYESRISVTAIRRLAEEWGDFSEITPAVKQEIVSAVMENSTFSPGNLKYKKINLQEYLEMRPDLWGDNEKPALVTFTPSALKENGLLSLENDE